MSSVPATASPRPPLWRDVRVLRVAGQMLFAVAILAVLWLLARNLLVNMGNRGLPTGFDYLNQPGGFRVANTPVTSSTPIWRVMLTGARNTLLVAGVGVALATALGVVIGVARLSTNWLVRKGAAAYVEAVRNIPVLVWIVFFGSAVILRLPPIGDAIVSPGRWVVSNAGVAVASPTTPSGGTGTLLVIGLVALVAGGLVAHWRTRLNERTGRPHRVLWATVVVVVVATGGYLIADVPLGLSRPQVAGFRVEGGFTVQATYLGVLVGLVVYTASHIAEIVRGSIQAVPRGQTEAADALALSPFQRLRHVVLPQATRIMVPPVANQYLNLTKNSSLAIAIGYSDLFLVVRTVIGNGRPAPQNLAIAMAFYLVFSLVISAFTNWYNRRIQYVTS